MADLLKGRPVAQALNEVSAQKTAALKQQGITPALAILRVGENEADLSYERTAVKRCQAIGAEVRSVVLPLDICQEDFEKSLQQLNEDDAIHGILMFQPLPKQLDGQKARRLLNPRKDVDGCTDLSIAGLFTGNSIGFAPCTAQAVIEILDYYNIEVTGRKVVVIGRSLVVGRPLSMLLLNRNATVTIAHSKTANLQEVSRNADILIVAVGKEEMIGENYLTPGQIVIDVGINYSQEKGRLCGDVNFKEADAIVASLTPVPNGVGTVTTSVLVKHVVEAAERSVSL